MKTTINNESRVFLVQRQGFFTRDIFCNLHDIPKVLNSFEKHDEFKISEYWNRKFKKCSKKHLNDMFEAHEINYKIK